MFFKISTKLILSFLLVVILSIAVTNYLSYLTAKESLKNQVLSDLILTAEIKEGYIYEFLESIKGRAIDFSSDGFIRDSTLKIVKKEKLNAQDLNTYLIKNKMFLDKTIFGINILNLNGTVIASTTESEIGKNESGADYFLRVKDLDYGKGYISDIFLSQHFDKEAIVITASAPLTHKETREKIGIIVNYYKTDVLNDILKGQRQLELGAISGTKGKKETQEIYLVNKNSFIITDSKYIPNAALKQKIVTEPIIQCRLKKEISEIYQNYVGISVVGASMCFPIFNWTMVAEIGEEEIFAELNNIGRNIFFVSLITLIFVLTLAYSLAKGITNPIKKLLEAVKKINEGNLKLKVEAKSFDEIGELGDAFNKMSENLSSAFFKISDSEKKLRLIIDNSYETIIILDLEGRYQFINKQGVLMKGLEKAEEIIGKKYSLFVLSDYKNLIEEAIKKAKGGNFFSFNYQTKIKDTVKWFKAVIGPIKTDLGEIISLIVIIQDITSQKIAELETAELEKLKTKFISIVSHQLRTPLNSIKWNLDLILEGEMGKLDKNQRKFIQLIRQNSQNIINNINDLLLTIDLEEKKVVLEKENVSFEGLVASVFKESAKSCGIKNLSCNFEFLSKPLPNIEIDAGKIRLVLNKLFDNAILYTPEDGKISVNVGSDGKNVIFSIADTGIGIPESEKHNIFKRFYRASNIALIYPNASGVGLYLAKSIIELHNGKIWFNSQEGAGTTFWFSLPL